MQNVFALIAVALLLSSCATYQYAERIKTVSFAGDLKKGESVGPIRGEDCTWHILGRKLGTPPTLDRAFINARHRADELEAAGLRDATADDDKKALRYVNNVSTSKSGFNAGLFGKNCLVVKGVGYL